MEKARKRLSGMEAIDTNLDLGNGLTAPAYRTKVETLTSKLSGYNTMLSDADEDFTGN